MRCPGCNKFVAYEEVDPEVEVQVDAEGHVTGTVQIVNACADCSEELKEANFDIDVDARVGANQQRGIDSAEFEKHKGHALGVDTHGIERTSRVEGKGRGARTFYGASVEIVVNCEDCEGTPVVATLTWADDEQASAMDELV